MMVLLPSEELLFGSTFRFQVGVATVLQGCTQHCPRGVRQRPSQREGFAQPDELCLGQQKMHENVWQRLAKCLQELGEVRKRQRTFADKGDQVQKENRFASPVIEDA